MGTHNICLYKEIDKKYIDCNLKTTELLDCTLIGECEVIRSNTVFGLQNRGKNNSNNYISQMKMYFTYVTPEVTDILKILWKRKEIAPLFYNILSLVVRFPC